LERKLKTLFKHKYKSPFGEIGLMADEENLMSVSITNPDFLNIEASLDSSRFTEVLTQLD
jgi:hypothetical protein